MKTRTVKPCGMLYAEEGVWYLLHPYPIEKDSWQGDNVYRFVCVSIVPIEFNEDAPNVYEYARHIVTNSFAIEYCADMKAIEVQVLDEIDITETELHDVNDEEVPNILQENDYGI